MANAWHVYKKHFSSGFIRTQDNFKQVIRGYFKANINIWKWQRRHFDMLPVGKGNRSVKTDFIILIILGDCTMLPSMYKSITLDAVNKQLFAYNICSCLPIKRVGMHKTLIFKWWSDCFDKIQECNFNLLQLNDMAAQLNNYYWFENKTNFQARK